MNIYLIVLSLLLINYQIFECKSAKGSKKAAKAVDKPLKAAPTDASAGTDASTTTDAGPGTDAGAASGGDDESQCGFRKVNTAVKTKKVLGAKGMGRIVGGVDALPYEFPWQVSLQIFIPKKKKVEHFCGGAIIDHYWILTASHCLDILKGKEKNLIVKMGSNKMKDANTPNYSVEKFVLHHGWDRKTQSNDIAVLKVKERIEYKVNDKQQYVVNRVCLPKNQTDMTTGMATLSGFGQTGATAGQSDYLQKLDVPIYDHAKCAINYKKYVKINDLKLCAGGKGGQDSCMGDSGGPLVRADGEKNEIVGVVSFGYPCAVKDMPGVYTKVSKYVDWIHQNTKD